MLVKLFYGLAIALLTTWVMISVPVSAQQSNCSPAYPDVCIPLAPPDLDCGDISARRFRVLQLDPHRFDGDKDGIGCEQ
jgi:micrococcal nuclease